MKINNPNQSFTQFKRDVNRWVNKDGSWSYFDWGKEQVIWQNMTQEILEKYSDFENIGNNWSDVIDKFSYAWDARKIPINNNIKTSELLNKLFI